MILVRHTLGQIVEAPDGPEAMRVIQGRERVVAPGEEAEGLVGPLTQVMDAYVPDRVCPPQDERTVVPLIRDVSSEHVGKLMNLVIGG
jgi:hypothetical protein